jgi:hypothetical protein
MKHLIKYTTIDKLKPFPGNPKDASPEKSLRLKNSVRKRGFLEPLNVWEKGRSIFVLDGNRRLEILEEICQEDGNRLLEIPIHPIECKDEADAMDICLTLADPAGDLNPSKVKRGIKKAGYKSIEEAQSVFSFLIDEDTTKDENSQQEDSEAPNTAFWQGATVVKSPTDGVFFYVKMHKVTEGFTEQEVWDEQNK